MKEGKTHRPQWKPTWKDVVLYLVLGLLFIGQIVLCILFYNWANLDWLLYLRWAILAIGFLMEMISGRAFQERGGAPDKKRWLQTTVVVDSGIYAIVRHPIYLGGILIVLALILISQHWLSVIFGIPIMVFSYASMRSEEQYNIEKFGDDYKRYMERVPQMNFFLGIIRLTRARK